MASTAAAGQTPDVSSTSPPASPVTPTQTTRRRYEYYKEESFGDIDLTRTVHLGWGAMGGAAIIFFCMGMSAATQSRSWNVSFRWLQRRVGAQFGTMSYIITSNLMYYHDGDKWVTRDWATILDRWSKKRRGGVAPA